MKALNKRGVALLEAMVSVSIVSVGLVTSMRALGFCTSTQSRIQERAVARRLAAEQLLVVTAQKDQAAQDESGGAFEEPFAGYSWSAKTFPETELAPFRLVQLTVWKGQGEARHPAYKLQTLVR